MKKFVLSFMLFAVSLTAWAQYQRWWGLYDETMPLTAVGTGVAETYHCGSYFSGGRAILNGATAHGVRFWLRDKTNVSNVKVWVSSARPASAEQADLLVMDVAQEEVKDQAHDGAMTEVPLPNPFTFDGSTTLYVGFSFRMNEVQTEADKSPVLYTKEVRSYNSFIIRTSKTVLSWNDLGSMSTYGALAMQLLISNPTLPNHSVAVGDAEPLTDLCGSVSQTTASIAAMGFAEVADIDYELTVAGQKLGEQHLTLDQPLTTAHPIAPLPLSIEMPQQNGVYDYQVRITKVNGQPNEYEAPSTNARLIAVDQKGKRRSVVEEYTGTWCTNCPRGIVGMQNMERDFGDDFIGIAIHTNPDPMVVSDFAALVNALEGGVPTCIMDRYLQCDPYLGDILTDYHYHASTTFQRMLDRTTEADISLNAYWADADQTTISYEVATTFHLDQTSANYALAFVLTADGLRGEGRQWYQVNGDSGNNQFPDEDMDVFRLAPNPVTDMEYNHVAIAATDVKTGIKGSIASPIVSGETQTFCSSINIASNTLVQDKTRLNAIVLLINTLTGEIVNAAKVAMADARTGIDNLPMHQPADPSAIYDLQGRKVVGGQLRSGIYLRSGRKVIVR